MLALAAALTGLAARPRVVARLDRPRRTAPAVTRRGVAETPRRLQPAQEWELVVRRTAQDLERGTALAALQAKAAVKLAAAEHAYNRLAADFAKLCRQPAAEPATPVRSLVDAPARAPRVPDRVAGPRPLAA